MERIAMSQEERDWLDWLKRARDGKMTQREAAERMGVTERWVRKLLRRMKKQGDAVVVHRLRGKASNRKLSAKTQKQALAILGKPDWHDFGPDVVHGPNAESHRRRPTCQPEDFERSLTCFPEPSSETVLPLQRSLLFGNLAGAGTSQSAALPPERRAAVAESSKFS
jgi:DNA-binding CsgD family transcriptional regulator